MWVYYQTAENGRQEWQLTSSDQEATIREQQAYHMSIYHLASLPESTEASEIRYKGDFWVDIDHSYETPEQRDQTIQLAIDDVNRMLDYLQEIKVDLNHCSYYASGSKGFHVRIPGKIIGGANSYKALPRVHKLIAENIKEQAGIEGMDLSLYSTGKGKLLRVANKQRANGNYKVPLTALEVRAMTPALYWQVVSTTKQEIPVRVPKGVINQELAILFGEAREAVKRITKATFDIIPSERLEPFIDNPPTCVSWITKNINMVSRTGGFNAAKMSLSRYLMSAPITDDARHELILEFANNWDSSRHRTAEARVKEVKGAANFGREHGFSCDMMTRDFVESPCKDCVIKAEQKAEHSEKAGIIVEPDGYYRPTAKGAGTKITNFTIKPVRKYVDDQDSDIFNAYDYEVYEQVQSGEVEVTRIITLDYRCWMSAAEFKKQIGQRGSMLYVGSDTDLQHLKSYLTSPIMDSGVKIVQTIRTVGIYHHIDDARDINEYVWVEPDWSINKSKVSNTIQYAGQRREVNGSKNNITLPMRTISTLDPKDQAFQQAYRKLLDVNRRQLVAPIIGWMAACWIKNHLMKGSDRHFPVLHLYGSAGSGKTETASLFSFLAGSDYCNGRPLVVSGATPYAIVGEAISTTTCPRILDEVNPHKIAQKGRYAAAREVVKAAATGGCMPQGTLGTGNHRTSASNVQLEERPVSSPIIMLATQENNESEIQQRAICLHIDTEFKSEDGHEENFMYVREHAQDVWPLAKALMVASLSTEQQWVSDRMKANRKIIPDGIDHRPVKNWQCTLTGLDFLVHTLQQNNVDKFLIDETSRLKDVVIAMLEENEKDLTTRSNKQEVDNIIDIMGEMATIVDINGDKRLKQGLHYIVQGTTLHIFATACFVMYVRYMKESGRLPELSDIRNFRGLLTNQPYFIGEGITKGVSVPKDWFSFSLPELEKRGVSVERFTAE